jgi:histidine triad (HIT) family protein
MCLFCKIVDKQIPSKMVFEDDEVFAFHDINPMAPTHILVIPKRHIVGLNEAVAEDQALLGKLLLSAQRAAQQTGIGETGYRVVVNNGPHAGQSVFHLHVHVLGGRGMAWPPG